MKKKVSKIAALLSLVALFSIVRLFENELFYDPFLSYFKSDFKNTALPFFNTPFLLLSYFFRYALNSLISLGVLCVVFSDKELLVFSSFLYLIFFGILFVFFIVFVHYFANSQMILFYIRRFMIQPILLLLFIPAFYFQKASKNI